PKILLLDEPFSNVDMRSARDMVQLLARMRDSGKTIFVVTHQASLLDGIADEFVWMDSGTIVNRTPTLQAFEAGHPCVETSLRQICRRTYGWSGAPKTPSTPCCSLRSWWW